MIGENADHVQDLKSGGSQSSTVPCWVCSSLPKTASQLLFQIKETTEVSVLLVLQ